MKSVCRLVSTRYALFAYDILRNSLHLHKNMFSATFIEVVAIVVCPMRIFFCRSENEMVLYCKRTEYWGHK